jgi:hypothetical protein
MSTYEAIDRVADRALDHFAAELTEAAYRVLLRRGVADNWLEMELELWQALKETVKKEDQEWPRAGVMLVERPRRHP